jgi:hypothetical protein
VEKVTQTLLIAAAGGLAGALTHRAAQRSGRPVAASAVLLVGAAVTYRFTDPGAAPGPERTRELTAVGATMATGVASALVPSRTGQRILAAGWLAHAVFDAVHHRNDTSHLPGWYPAFCAGFDTVVAGQLIRESAAS